jgi:2-keto-3-deoxy-L-rhamnonate aldolase RhmA
MSRMFDRFANGQMAVGTMMMEHGPEWMELLGYVGMDYGIADMMNASIDWRDASEMVRALDRNNVTPWIRLQSYPWGSDDMDPRLPADVFRALGLGAEGVMASVNTARAVERLLVPLKEDEENDWVHTRPYLNRPLYMPRDGSVRRDDDKSTRRMVVPDLESVEALKNLDEILEVDGLQAIFISLADISQAMGHPFDYSHPEMMKVVTDSCAKAAKKGVIVFTFTGGSTPDEVGERVKTLWEAGVRGMYVPRLTVAAQRFYERMLHSVEEKMPEARH